MAAALIAAIWFLAEPAATWAGGWTQTWNLYHYVVGVRFFGELGYDDLYVATLEVDRRHDDAFAKVDVVRDLETYEKGPRASVVGAYDVDRALSPERQEELDGLVRALREADPKASWRDMFRDRGFNGTPSYTAVASVVARALPAEHATTRWLSTAIDPLLILIGLAAIGWAYGTETTAWVVLLLAVFPGTVWRWFGGFLQYDWLAALMIAAAAVKKQKPEVAGAALAWATASRLFPAALLVSLLIPDLRPGGDRVFARRLVLAFAVALAIFVGVGCLTPRGPGAWLEFVPRILHHSEQHVLGDQRIGWRHLALWTTPEQLREAVLHARAVPIGVGVVLGLGAWGVAVWRRSREEALQLAWIVVFLVTVSSRYYWAGAALLPTVGPARGRWLAVGFAATAVAHAWARALGADKHGAYLAVDLVIAVVLAAWAVSCMLSDRVSDDR
ncbi:MAG: DUF2029 domain-containing protein [Alphaproteobacteria bacterium]|nr:DUF2029 domain-containing protein [Alphaproteobacteria bacterium]